MTHRSEREREAPGLAFVPKLKYEHTRLTSFSKMRVDLAAQVLSESVSKAIALTGGEAAQETARFVSMIDKFFDCLNVNSFTAGRQSRKAFKAPYRHASDFRLKWLKEEFLAYLDSWEQSVEQREGYKNSVRKKMLLSDETRRGLRMTVHSFVELVEYLFTVSGVEVFLSERLCQDPLEKFFGCQRQRGGVHDNPSTQEFFKNTQALRVIGTVCRDVKGNCRGHASSVDWEKENTPLPKRRKSNSSSSCNVLQ